MAQEKVAENGLRRFSRNWFVLFVSLQAWGFLSGISQLSNDPSLSSLPLLSTFLKSYGRPYLGLTFSDAAGSQVSASETPGSLSANTQIASLGAAASSTDENELVEKETRERLKRMCEGYFDTISKKLVKEHLVCIFMCVVAVLGT